MGEAKLETFYDPFKAGRACELLEASEIAFRLEDQSVPGDALQAFDGSPPVVLAIFVAARELERAQVALRAMGLFVPESQELDGADSIEDEDDVHWTVAGFESEEEAQALTDRLKTAGIAASVLDLTEDAEAKEMRFYVEVPEEQRVRAETWLEHNWAEPE